jgi:hypothetical protein
MLIQDPSYQNRWPVELADDQNVKTQFNTSKGGWRMSIPMNGSFVGEHPHGKIIDDPHDTNKKVLTEQEIQTAIEVFDFGLPSRGATLNAWTVLMMQRLHERDLSGHWLSRADPSVVHLCLPMKYERPRLVVLERKKASFSVHRRGRARRSSTRLSSSLDRGEKADSSNSRRLRLVA